jgi:hypothetical protein
MGLLKPPKLATARIIFNAPAELGIRLKALESKAAKRGIAVSLDKDLATKLARLIDAAEKELAHQAEQRQSTDNPAKSL